jgi:hypothetical protein
MMLCLRSVGSHQAFGVRFARLQDATVHAW